MRVVVLDVMRDQYAGDITDLIKFSLLRALAGKDRRLGVAWYYAVGDDNKPDGRHREWIDETHWRDLDPSVHLDLANLPERKISVLEQCSFWPNGVQFHAEPIPAFKQRVAWLNGKRTALEGCDLVFLDPDNGLGKSTKKYATFAELDALRAKSRAILFISFPHQGKTHEAQMIELHTRTRAETGATCIATLRTNVSVPVNPGSKQKVQRPRWFTLIDFDDILKSRLHEFHLRLSSLPLTRAYIDVFSGER